MKQSAGLTAEHEVADGFGAVSESQIVAQRMRCAAVMMLMCISFSACDREQRSASVPAVPLRCEDLSLDGSAAPPMSRVPVSGVLPAAIEVVQVTAASAGDSVGYPIGLLHAGEESVDMIVPVHPDGRLEGGQVQLRFASGGIECEPLPFTITALQPAPGTLRQVTSDLQNLLAVQLRLIGGSTDALRAADPDTLVPPLLLLYLAQVVIDHPDNPASLRAALESRASQQGSAAGELADALLAASAFHEDVRTLPNRSMREAVEHQASAASHNVTSAFRLASYRQQSPAFTLPGSGGCSYPLGDAFTRPDAETLSCWMRLALYGELATTGKPAVTYTVFTGALAAGAALAKAVPHPVGRTVAIEAMAVASAAALAYKLEMEAFSRLLPRRFVPNSLEFDLNPASFNEDDPGPGRWSNARIEAQSEGWSMDRALLDVVMQAAQVPWVAEQMLGEAGGAADTRMVEIPEQRFGPVDITDEKWTDARITGEAVQHDLEAGRPFYRPHRVGQSTIRISTRPGMFGVEHQDREEPLRLEAIEVLLSPQRSPVDPGDVRRIHLEIRNATDRRVDWTIQPDGRHRLSAQGSEPGFIEVVTSERVEDLPARLTVRSIADRSHLDVAPVRSETAVLLPNMLTFDPPGACVRPGERQRFTVIRPDLSDDNVRGGGRDGSGEDYRWSATAGSIDRRGEFRGPSSNGTATVTAVDRENPALRGELEVTYGEQCTSWYAYTAAGDLNLTDSGPLLAFMGLRRPPVGECHLSIPLMVGADADTPVMAGAEADKTLTLVALLPDGLQRGTYRVAPSFSGNPDANVGSAEGMAFKRLWISSGSLEQLTRGAFHAQLHANAEYGDDDRDDAFVSRSGTVTVEEFDGTRVSVSFSIDLVQTSPEGEWVAELTPDAERMLADGYPFGSEMAKRAGREQIRKVRAQYAQNPPRRSTTVTGRFSHVIEGRMMFKDGKLPDFYACAPSATEPQR